MLTPQSNEKKVFIIPLHTQNHHLLASHHSKKELSSELGLEKDKNLFMFANKKPIIIKGDQFSRNALCINY